MEEIKPDGDGQLTSAVEEPKPSDDAQVMMKDLEQLIDEITKIATKVEVMFTKLGELVRSTNSASMTIACVEQFLDAKFKGWNRGARRAVELKAKGLEDRAALLREAQETQRNGNSAQLSNVAHRLWDLAKKLGTEKQDVAVVVAFYLKARDLRHAADLLEEVKDLELPELVRGMLNELTMRMRDLEVVKPKLISLPAKSDDPVA